MKYVVFKFIGAEVPVLFPDDLLNHDNVRIVSDKYPDGKAVSAGRCAIEPIGSVRVWGDSFSLGIKSRKKDATLIKKSLSL